MTTIVISNQTKKRVHYSWERKIFILQTQEWKNADSSSFRSAGHPFYFKLIINETKYNHFQKEFY